MKKILSRVLAAVVAVATVVTSFTAIADEPAAESTKTEDGVVFSIDYNEKSNGIVDRKKAAYLTKDDTSQGEKALKIVPMTEDYEVTKITVDCYSISYSAAELAKVKFVTVRYKYVAPDGIQNASKMRLNLLPNGGALKNTVSAYSGELVKNEWATAIFNVSAIENSLQNEEGKIFRQFHLCPYGDSPLETLDASEVMYISEIVFYSKNPDPNATYTISFSKNNPDADGSAPDKLQLKEGEEYTLPENPYTLVGGSFNGWKSSEDNQIYPAGTKFVAKAGDMSYIATFTVKPEDVPVISLKFTDYCNGIVNHIDTASTENVTFDGRSAVKITPNKEHEKQEDRILLDGWSYKPAGINLEHYKYLVICYYLDGNLSKEATFHANYMRNGDILTKIYGNASTQTLKSGVWDFIVIDLSGVTEFLNPATDNHNLVQMHLQPFNGLTLADLSGDEAIYISQLMFCANEPIIEVHEKYMNGVGNANFNPNGNMTRAEACTIVARLSAGGDDNVPTDKACTFADVAQDAWYHKYVSYVESLGYLKSYSGNFEPNKAITRAEFVELVYNMGLLADKGQNGTFSDVPADHPKANVISAAGKAGLINGYDNGNGTYSFKPDNTITRAEVVKVINNAYSRSITDDALSEDVKFSFADVDYDFWAYADICEATLTHAETKESWLYAITSPNEFFEGREIDYEAGVAYLAELDKISEEKKQSIINSKTEIEVSGTKYYVSAETGNDSNDGKSPETAWKTITKLNNVSLKKGDGVFFKRGDIYRTRFTARAGVTYSAYGEGEKPRFYGSPENGADPAKWTLMDGTNNIWVYATQMVDVGAIVLDEKESALKEVPNLWQGVHYVRGSKNTVVFDIKTELDKDLEFFSDIKSTNMGNETGKIYLRCDKGNPGEIYNSIEFNTKNNVISVGGNDITFDNICVMFGGSHGIGSGTVNNLTVQNCTIGWIGGAIQYYNEADGNVVRFGNGIEIYGGCDGYTVDNCYIYQCYDAGVTHQYGGKGNENNSMYNVTYSNNIIEDCIYSIEYFNGDGSSIYTIRDGKNYKIVGNILRRAGYGFGNQRPDGNASSHLKGWTSRNEYEKGTYRIENNIFDRGMWSLVQTQASYKAWLPVYDGNTYVQFIGGPIGYHTGPKLEFDVVADMTIKAQLGDKNATVYFLPAEYAYQGDLTRTR